MRHSFPHRVHRTRSQRGRPDSGGSPSTVDSCPNTRNSPHDLQLAHVAYSANCSARASSTVKRRHATSMSVPPSAAAKSIAK
jgi:hypothetical protein